MPVPAINVPMSSPSVQPSSVRPNPMAPAISTPVGNAPPQQPTLQPPPVMGTIQGDLPPSQAAQKTAALYRAELISLMYKYGAMIRHTPKSDATKGALIGGGVGALGGAALGAHMATGTPPEPALVSAVDKIVPRVMPTGTVQDKAKALLGIAEQTQAIADKLPPPVAQNWGTMPVVSRLKEVIRSKGIGNVMAKLGPTALIAAGLGAGAGAIGGLAYHSLRDKKVVKRASGSILMAQATHPLTQKLPEVWDPWKQETIDQLASELPPVHKQAPMRAGTARLTNRSNA